MTKELSNLFASFIGCPICGEFLGTRFIDINDEVQQRILKKDGMIVNHSYCPDCAAQINRDIEVIEFKKAA